MPTPVGHSLAGIAVYALSQRDDPLKLDREKTGWAALAITASNAPDLDFFGWADGGLVISAAAHHGVTHSIGFAVMMGAACGLWAFARGYEKAVKAFAITAAAWSLHVVIDLFSIDNYPANGIGLPALWPVSDTYYILPFMNGVSRADPFSMSSVIGLAAEILLYGSMALAAILWKRSGRRAG